MAGTALRGALAGAVVLLGGLASAGEPLLPPPRSVAPEVMVGPFSSVRPDPYAVWQNYGVDRTGHWRPLVVPTPYAGLRYVATGEPYPWWPNHPGIYRPWVANAATFGSPPAFEPLLAPAPLPVLPPPTGWERMPYEAK
jgi:hypothetical protein